MAMATYLLELIGMWFLAFLMLMGIRDGTGEGGKHHVSRGLRLLRRRGEIQNEGWYLLHTQASSGLSETVH